MGIAGWSEAMLTLMTEGDKIELVIPPELAYGPRGRGDVIPADIGYLVFEVHLLHANVHKYWRALDSIIYTDFKNPYVWMVIVAFSIGSTTLGLWEPTTSTRNG